MSALSFPVFGSDILQGLESTHNVVRVTPLGQEPLSYSLILPKGWVTEEGLGEQKDGIGNLVKIGLFSEKIGIGATVVQVFFSRIPFEIGVRDWLEYEAERFGTNLEHCREYEFACGPVVDAGGTYGPVSNEQVIRLLAHPDSARIFLVSAMTPRTRYATEQNNITIATNSFKLLRPSGTVQLEQWLDTDGGSPSFHVAYPATWSSRPVESQVPGKSGVDIMLVRDEQLAAYIRVKATDPNVAGVLSIAEALKAAEEELREGGVVLVSPWEADADPSIQRVAGLSGVFLAMGEMSGQAIQLRFGRVNRDNLAFSITLISVERVNNSILWMRSKRAYEIALATARGA